MAKSFEFSILAKFRDMASAGLKALTRTLKTTAKAATGGLFGTRGILGTFMPGSLIAGGLFGGIVSAAKFAVKGVISAFTGMVKAVVSIVRTMVTTVAGILRSLVKTAAVIGGAIGAYLGYTIIRGIKENMELADVRQVLRKLLGVAADEAERFARDLSLRTPFTPMQMLRSSMSLAAVGADVKRYLGDLADWAAGAQRPIEELLMTFQRGFVGQFGEAMEGARRGLISLKDMQRMGAEFTGSNQFKGTPQQFVDMLMAAARERFGGMAEQAAAVGKGPLSTFLGVIQELRVTLSEPWYERFNQGLIDLNNWLLAVAVSPAWEKIVGQSERLAKALDEGVRGAIEYLTTRDWEAVWGGFKETVAGLPAFVEQNFAAIRTVVENTLGILQNKAQNIIDEVIAYLDDEFGAAVTEWGRRVQAFGAGEMAAAGEGPGLFTGIKRGARERVDRDVEIGIGAPGGRNPMLGLADLFIAAGATVARGMVGEKMTPAQAARFKLGAAMEEAGRGIIRGEAGAAGIAEDLPAKAAAREEENQALLREIRDELAGLRQAGEVAIAPAGAGLAARAPVPVPVQTPEQQLAYAREAREEVRAKIAELERVARLHPELDLSESIDWLVKMLQVWNDQEVRVLGAMEDGLRRVDATAKNNAKMLQAIEARLRRLGEART